MKKWVSDILTVQQYDMRMRDLEIKYRTIPQERARLRDELLEASEAVKAAREEFSKLEIACKKLEAAIADLNEKNRKTQTQSAMVKKNAEYQAMMADIEATRAKISDLETEEIELIDRIDAAKKRLAETEREYIAAERQTKAELADFDELVETIKKEVLEIKDAKKNFIKVVELNVLNAYRHILEKDKGKPVVPIANGSCSHCLLKVTPQLSNQAKKGELIFCDNCSHILYDPNAPE
ncbi:MAG: putative zinc ribbon domain protein [Lentisphaerae bacterium ADurb.Bin242]|nr:MAG: putative zinc ribbon domain protein [Lentisphaerae bacterium ADurb.Bin242]